MNINVKATNMTVTPDIADYLQKKMNMLDRLIDPTDTSVSCEVEVGKTTRHHKSGDIFRAEINLRKDGKMFRAVAEEETILAAIDEVKDEMHRVLGNDKNKQQTMLRRSGAAVKNMLRGVGEGIGTGWDYGVSGIKKIGKINWRRRRRDN